MKAADVTAKVKAASRQTVPVTVVLDPDLALEVEKAEQALRLAERKAEEVDDDLAGTRSAEAQAAVEQAQDRLNEVVAAAEEVTETFRLASIGPKRWRELERQHPPTDESRRLHGRSVPFDPATFCDAAIVASLVDPDDATTEWWDDLCGPDGLTHHQWEQVWSACNLANNGGVEVPKSLRSSNGTTGTG